MTAVNRKIHVVGINSYTFKDLPFKLNHNHNSEDDIGDFLEKSVNHEHKYSISKPREVEKKQPTPQNEYKQPEEDGTMLDDGFYKPSEFNFFKDVKE